MTENERDDWIICVNDSCVIGAEMLRFQGSEDDAAQMLIELIKQDKSPKRGFIRGTAAVTDIIVENNGMVAYALYTSGNIQYTAKKLSDVGNIDFM